MASFSGFLGPLLAEGKVIFGPADEVDVRPGDADVAELGRVFAGYALSVGGPPIGFDARSAREAATLVRRACWALVDGEQSERELRRRLAMPISPSTPAEHLSADLMFRYLPQVRARALAIAPADPIVEILGEVLRRWPLSGALSDIEEGPIGATDFGGHPGLLLLFAERLAAHDRPSWRPGPSSPAHDVYQLVAGTSPAVPGVLGWLPS